MARGRSCSPNVLKHGLIFMNMDRGLICPQQKSICPKTWPEVGHVLKMSYTVICSEVGHVFQMPLKNQDCTVEQNVQCCTLYQTLYILQVVGFDGSTTMDEFTISLTSLIGCRSPDLSGFAIFSDDPIEAGVDHSLAGSDKVKIY